MTPVGLRQTREVLKPCRTNWAFSWASPCFFLPHFFLLVFCDIALNDDPDCSPDPRRLHPQKLKRTGWSVGKLWQRLPGTAGKEGRSGQSKNDFPSHHDSAALPLLSTAYQSCLNANDFIIHLHTTPRISSCFQGPLFKCLILKVR